MGIGVAEALARAFDSRSYRPTYYPMWQWSNLRAWARADLDRVHDLMMRLYARYADPERPTLIPCATASFNEWTFMCLPSFGYRRATWDNATWFDTLDEMLAGLVSYHEPLGMRVTADGR